MAKKLESRRDFLKTSAAVGATLAANLSLLSNVHAEGSDTIRVGLIGCGGRGSGAAENVLSSAKSVKLVALGDVFQDGSIIAMEKVREIGPDSATFAGDLVALVARGPIAEENLFSLLPAAAGEFWNLPLGRRRFGGLRCCPGEQNSAQLQGSWPRIFSGVPGHVQPRMARTGFQRDVQRKPLILL